MPNDPYLLYLLFFVIALLYASVGFGGGSSYLALLSLFAVPYQEIKTIALVCNIVVVSQSTIKSMHSKLYDWKNVLPLLILSVPSAYFGSKFPLSERAFFLILASALFLASLLLFFQDKLMLFKVNIPNSYRLPVGLLLGASIGFFSGMVGIGGGIFLSPILFILNWDNAKSIAAMASIFILLNSLASLLGQTMPSSFIFYLVLAVAVGGYIGSSLLLKVFNPKTIRILTSVLILYVSYTIFSKHL